MRTPNPEHKARLLELFSTSPVFSLLNMVIREATTDSSLVTLDLETKHQHPLGHAHGGVIASIVDTAAFWALFYSVPDETARIISVDLKLNFLSVVSQGQITARGKKIKLGESIGYASVEVTDEENKIIASGSSTVIVLPGKAYSIDPPLPPKFLD